jgi:hypothetical protein
MNAICYEQRHDIGFDDAQQIHKRGVTQDAGVCVEHPHANPAQHRVYEHHRSQLIRMHQRFITSVEKPMGDEA